MLKVEGLNAGYGSVNILWDIGFEVKDGEIVAILGSNGAGKTTMVRTITGMVKASSGKVEFNGEDLSGKSSRVILDSGIVQVPEGRQPARRYSPFSSSPKVTEPESSVLSVDWGWRCSSTA